MKTWTKTLTTLCLALLIAAPYVSQASTHDAKSEVSYQIKKKSKKKKKNKKKRKPSSTPKKKKKKKKHH